MLEKQQQQKEEERKKGGGKCNETHWKEKFDSLSVCLFVIVWIQKIICKNDERKTATAKHISSGWWPVDLVFECLDGCVKWVKSNTKVCASEIRTII